MRVQPKLHKKSIFLEKNTYCLQMKPVKVQRQEVCLRLEIHQAAIGTSVLSRMEYCWNGTCNQTLVKIHRSLTIEYKKYIFIEESWRAKHSKGESCSGAKELSKMLLLSVVLRAETRSGLSLAFAKVRRARVGAHYQKIENEEKEPEGWKLQY